MDESTRTLRDLYSSNELTKESLDIYMYRFRQLDSVFQKCTILDRVIDIELFTLLASTAERLQNYLLPEEEGSRERMIENYGIILLAAVNLDSEGNKFGRRSNERKSHLMIETIRILAGPTILFQTQTRDLKELIHLCLTEKLAEFLVSDYLDRFSDTISKSNNKLYLRIYNNPFVDKIDSLHYLLFMENKVSFVYFDRYLELDEFCQEEFWKWINLKHIISINNPGKLFFDTLDDVIENGFGFKRVITRRLRIEDKAAEDSVRTTSGRIYIIDDELRSREEERQAYDPNIFHLANSKEAIIDKHHLFFPSKKYQGEGNGLFKFINNLDNCVRIKKSSHRIMNSFFDKLHDYSIPILTPSLTYLILDYRVTYINDFENFVSLQESLLLIAADYSQKPEGQLAIDVYDFLRIQARFVTPSTVKPKTTVD